MASAGSFTTWSILASRMKWGTISTPSLKASWTSGRWSCGERWPLPGSPSDLLPGRAAEGGFGTLPWRQATKTVSLEGQNGFSTYSGGWWVPLGQFNHHLL